MVREQWIQSLRDEIAEVRERHLKPLEDGSLRIFQKAHGGQSEDTTQADIASLHKNIDNMQAIVDRYDAEYGRNA